MNTAERKLLTAISFSRQVRFVFPILLFIAPSSFWAQEVRFETRGPGVLDRAVLLTERRFTPEVIGTLARQFVQENHGQYLFRLTMGCDQDDLRLSFFGRREQSYREVIETLSHIELPKRPMAQVVGMRERAVLRYRDETRMTEEVISGNTDPTLFHVGKIKFKLLHFYLNDAERMSASARYSLQLFMEVNDTMSVGACAAITKRIVRDSGFNNVSLAFRSDPWFLENDRFPLIYRFSSGWKLPDELSYLTARSLKCSVSVGVPFGCGGNNFVP